MKCKKYNTQPINSNVIRDLGPDAEMDDLGQDHSPEVTGVRQSPFNDDHTWASDSRLPAGHSEERPVAWPVEPPSAGVRQATSPRPQINSPFPPKSCDTRTAESHYNLRSRPVNPTISNTADHRKDSLVESEDSRLSCPLPAASPPKATSTYRLRSATREVKGGQSRRLPAASANREVTRRQEESPPSQFTTSCQLEHCSPCSPTPSDFRPAPAIHRPRGVEPDLVQGDSTKANRVDLPDDDYIATDCERLNLQVLDGGFIHSLS